MVIHSSFSLLRPVLFIGFATAEAKGNMLTDG